MFFSKKKEERKLKKEKPKKTVKSLNKQASSKKTAEQATDRELMADGWIKAIIVFELAGKPKEHIEKTMKAYLANIKSDGRIKVKQEEYGDTEEHDDGIFSTFCEIEAVVVNLDTLNWLAVNFMPASIEVIEPDKPEINANHITGWFNDLLAKLHETSNVMREERSVNAHLTEALNALIKNSLIIAAKEDAKTESEFEKVLGIPKKQLEPFIKFLTEKGKLQKKGPKYSAK